MPNASIAILLAVLLLTPAAAPAQSPADAMRRGAGQAADLEFPTETSGFSIFTSPSMAIYKPDGAGPFPAVVILHQCGGLRGGRWQNMAILGWAKEAVARGYVALVVDALGPRNVDTVCLSPKGEVNYPRGVKDAMQAAGHLSKLDFVDRRRIALAGYSWGGTIGLLASSRLWATTLGEGERYVAVVSFYPGCFPARPPGGGSYEVVYRDIDRPLLVLAGEDDAETPPADCVSRLEPLRAAGAPVEWHVYKGTGHCWDCENLDGFSKVDFRGTHVVYRYDSEATKDSARRMFEFIEKSWPPRP
jgi:dienelactone hydrolase